MADAFTLARMQFALGPSDLAEAVDRPLVEVGAGYYLALGEHLGCSICEDGGRGVYLLGEAIDGDRPDLDRDTLARALMERRDLAGVIERTRSLAGRWVVLIRDGEELLLLTDPVGLCPVYYTTGSEPVRVLSSSAAFLRRRLGEAVSSRFNDLLNDPNYFGPERIASPDWKYDRALRTTGWPLSITPYERILHLVPNHYLNVSRGCAVRFWPSAAVDRCSVKEATGRTSERIVRLVEAAAQRYKTVWLQVTAGLDSRVLLAACAKAGIDVRAFTYVLPEHEQHPPVKGRDFWRDASIAEHLCDQAGIEHRRIELFTGVEEDVVRQMFANIDFLVSAPWLPLIQYRSQPEGNEHTIILNGNASEIGRAYFGRIPSWLMDANLVAKMANMAQVPFAVTEFKRWLEQVQPIAQRCGYEVPDLVYWEQRMGGWLSHFQQQVIPRWTMLTPYNCRAILEDLLAVPYMARVRCDVHRGIVAELCPRLSEVPINPDAAGLNSGIRARVKRTVKALSKRNGYVNYVWRKTRSV